MTTTPIFGVPRPGVTYRDRPGAYALMRDDRGHLAIIETSLGYFLPGGGLDAGESPEQALARELLEEISFSVASARFLGKAMQYHWSEFYQAHFRKIGHFFGVEAHLVAGGALQAGHALLWWTPAEAAQKLSHEFQRWAVTQFAP